MKPLTKYLNEQNKILFEKAIKFYFFSRQQSIAKLNSTLSERLTYAGRVAYSLIVTYVREGTLKLEYMDFINEELKTLLDLDSSYLSPLQIKPDEIDEIVLKEEITLRFFDEDEGRNLILSYTRREGKVELAPV